jgi:hypothetical protein
MKNEHKTKIGGFIYLSQSVTTLGFSLSKQEDA